MLVDTLIPATTLSATSDVMDTRGYAQTEIIIINPEKRLLIRNEGGAAIKVNNKYCNR